VYAHAWALTGDASLLAAMTGVLDYVERELATPDGGFAASQDADTEGEEGATFTWTAAEVREVLADDAALFSAARSCRASAPKPSWRNGSARRSTTSRAGSRPPGPRCWRVARRAPSPHGTTRCWPPGTA
jgi:hypothetical protein